MSGILVLAEHDGGTFKKTTFELLGKAKELAGTLGTGVFAAVLGEAQTADLNGFGASKVFVASGEFSQYDAAHIVTALQAMLDASGADVLLAPASYLSKDALPRLVARLNSGQATECTDLRVDGSEIVGRRPMFAGKCFVDVRISRSPAVFTVRANSFAQPTADGSSAEVIAVEVPAASGGLKIVERKRPEVAAVDLTEAGAIVSGGRSLKSKENFDSVIRPLAAALNATAGASRAAVDAGYAPHGDQVGQTGKTVNPSLYIACGISGAIQHLAGMRTSKVIVAINKDAEAPIFEHATYGIVADLFDICPALQEELGTL